MAMIRDEFDMRTLILRTAKRWLGKDCLDTADLNVFLPMEVRPVVVRSKIPSTRRRKSGPCDLCGEKGHTELYSGARFGLEGEICYGCRRELLEEERGKKG